LIFDEDHCDEDGFIEWDEDHFDEDHFVFRRRPFGEGNFDEGCFGEAHSTKTLGQICQFLTEEVNVFNTLAFCSRRVPSFSYTFWPLI